MSQVLSATALFLAIIAVKVGVWAAVQVILLVLAAGCALAIVAVLTYPFASMISGVRDKRPSRVR